MTLHVDEDERTNTSHVIVNYIKICSMFCRQHTTKTAWALNFYLIAQKKKKALQYIYF